MEIKTGSSRVTISGNVIEKGHERGISLGSPPAVNTAEQHVIAVRISDNQIRDMGAEGIGMPYSVAGGLVTNVSLFDASIEENLIERCLNEDTGKIGYVTHAANVAAGTAAISRGRRCSD